MPIKSSKIHPSKQRLTTNPIDPKRYNTGPNLRIYKKSRPHHVESKHRRPATEYYDHIYGDVIVAHRELTLHLTHPQSGQRSVRLAEENRLVGAI